MTGSLNKKAIYTQYGHFENGGRQWSNDTSCNCLPGHGNGLIRIIEILGRFHRFAQDVFAVSHQNRQGPDR